MSKRDFPVLRVDFFLLPLHSLPSILSFSFHLLLPLPVVLLCLISPYLTSRHGRKADRKREGRERDGSSSVMFSSLPSLSSIFLLLLFSLFSFLLSYFSRYFLSLPWFLISFFYFLSFSSSTT